LEIVLFFGMSMQLPIAFFAVDHKGYTGAIKNPGVVHVIPASWSLAPFRVQRKALALTVKHFYGHTILPFQMDRITLCIIRALP
jgi:hypothetical protein